MPRIDGLRVVHSAVHGYGVIATRDFVAGELIADVEGVLYREPPPDDTYCLEMPEGCEFDMVDQTRWINHSCDPNAAVEVGLDGADVGWALIRAIRPIAAGEEIFYDYAFAPEFAEPCNCGAANCRGWIIDPDTQALRSSASSSPTNIVPK